MNKSIFQRLFFTNVMILLMVFVLLSVSATIFTTRYMFNQKYESIASVSNTIEYLTGVMQIEETDVRARRAYKQTVYSWAKFLNCDIIVINKDNEVIEYTGAVKTVPTDLAKKVISGKEVRTKTKFANAYEDSVYSIGMPVKYNGSIVAGMFFNTKIPEINKNVINLMLILIIPSLFSIFIAFIFVYIQSMKISRPIRQINNAVLSIASGDFKKRVAVNSADEIGQLASSFNFMADSIEKTEASQTSFVSDVSHELRTPMTSISGFISGILDGTIPEEKHEYYLNIVLDESRRLTRLVNDMLEMTKMSSSEYKLDVTEFDINELIRVCIISLESRLTNKNLDLNVDFEKDRLMVLGDKDSIKRVILNLLDNAIKFSYPNTTIGISTKIDNKKAQVAIGNFGDGIKGSELSNIFDRFYKTDKSRTSEKTGAGLGLSLVKNIITLHKQQIWVESLPAKEGSDAKYTRFTFTLEIV